MQRTADRFTISQVAARTGMSVHALRFYERAGLLREDVDRVGGRRVYTEDHIEWLALVSLLRQAGMPLAAIREYAKLVRRGDGTEAQRLELLHQHQHHVASQLRDLSRCLDIINHKIGVYEDLINRGLPASSCHAPPPAPGLNSPPPPATSRPPRQGTAATP